VPELDKKAYHLLVTNVIDEYSLNKRAMLARFFHRNVKKLFSYLIQKAKKHARKHAFLLFCFFIIRF